MQKDVEKYVGTCTLCQENKTPKNINHGELIPLLPTRPFELVTTDILGPIRTTSKN
jgi:hypothetical protein